MKEEAKKILVTGGAGFIGSADSVFNKYDWLFRAKRR